MKHREVRLTDGALQDINNAVNFYDQIEYGLGRYFFDSIITDMEALEFFGGLHQQRFGHYASPAKRFPFIIYYKIGETFVDVRAVLDTRENPVNTDKRLER
ncbi:hypothetical protein [Marinobacter halophilus]|uniref:Type II toxin-antitoxin system RelE/ParE family toxin n=1 Tax=Marinobacter halophilus TaxID=1323740 RepID=A0A2T1KCN9_9GAMM|nr:hypothetical protein [Marinobacter halophilus]PSF07865.1 hypothetical protein C7H08_10710 [Marinobacter halophilus]GGC57764.1 hypothetical protein GCM10011362_02690 [Marinobacter halophilus]